MELRDDYRKINWKTRSGGRSRKNLGSALSRKICKGKVYPVRDHEGPEVWRYSSTLSITSTLDVGGWSMPRPGRFIPVKDPVPVVQEAPRSHPTGFDPLTVQPVVSRYTD